jgi:hypothetical protein
LLREDLDELVADDLPVSLDDGGGADGMRAQVSVRHRPEKEISALMFDYVVEYCMRFPRLTSWSPTFQLRI